MIAAMIHFIRFTGVLEWMTTGNADRGDARFIGAIARLPALNFVCAFEPMFPAVFQAVFLTDHFIKVFIRLTFGGATAAFKTGLGVFAYRIIFAVHVCTAIDVRRLGIDTCVTAFDKTSCLASLRRL